MQYLHLEYRIFDCYCVFIPLEPKFEQQTGEYSALISYNPDAPEPWKVEPHSHYLLLTDSVSIPGNWQLEEMATLLDAVMYRNLAANCD